MRSNRLKGFRAAEVWTRALLAKQTASPGGPSIACSLAKSSLGARPRTLWRVLKWQSLLGKKFEVAIEWSSSMQSATSFDMLLNESDAATDPAVMLTSAVGVKSPVTILLARFQRFCVVYWVS
eukprot:gb/GFBE01030464.1/.p1 GENE.gb/GFBE01030464.1/~~gb/GFBE01030464.1/.p1  ORF type:complete len:123 (+),score=18.29 gb/GFBE01030464.1/:1-369(+)